MVTARKDGFSGLRFAPGRQPGGKEGVVFGLDAVGLAAADDRAAVNALAAAVDCAAVDDRNVFQLCCWRLLAAPPADHGRTIAQILGRAP